jgi:hypothetical protein
VTSAAEAALIPLPGGTAEAMPLTKRNISSTLSLTDHRIRDEEDFEIRRTYIHRNPVIAGSAKRRRLTPSPRLRESCVTSAAEAAFIPLPGGTAEAVPLTKRNIRRRYCLKQTGWPSLLRQNAHLSEALTVLLKGTRSALLRAGSSARAMTPPR